MKNKIEAVRRKAKQGRVLYVHGRRTQVQVLCARAGAGRTVTFKEASKKPLVSALHSVHVYVYIWQMSDPLSPESQKFVNDFIKRLRGRECRRKGGGKERERERAR